MWCSWSLTTRTARPSAPATSFRAGVWVCDFREGKDQEGISTVGTATVHGKEKGENFRIRGVLLEFTI